MLANCHKRAHVGSGGHYETVNDSCVIIYSGFSLYVTLAHAGVVTITIIRAKPVPLYSCFCSDSWCEMEPSPSSEEHEGESPSSIPTAMDTGGEESVSVVFSLNDIRGEALRAFDVRGGVM